MKTYPLFLLVLLFPLCLSAQNRADSLGYDPSRMKNTFFTGGSLGMQFGTVTMIDVSPQFGYYPLEHISVGLGFTYQYINDRRYMPRFDVHVLGGRAFARLYLPMFDNIFGHLEYEYMTYKVNDPYQSTYLEWVELNNFLAGVGYRQRIGGRSSINLMILWNFNDSPYSLYANPVIRVGADIGL